MRVTSWLYFLACVCVFIFFISFLLRTEMFARPPLNSSQTSSPPSNHQRHINTPIFYFHATFFSLYTYTVPYILCVYCMLSMSLLCAPASRPASWNVMRLYDIRACLSSHCVHLCFDFAPDPHSPILLYYKCETCSSFDLN